jgi:hypothetical protein
MPADDEFADIDALLAIDADVDLALSPGTAAMAAEIAGGSEAGGDPPAKPGSSPRPLPPPSDRQAAPPPPAGPKPVNAAARHSSVEKARRERLNTLIREVRTCVLRLPGRLLGESGRRGARFAATRQS